LALKERMQCKSFQWYMDNVAYDVLDKYPMLPANVKWGELQNVGKEKCVDALGRQPPAVIGLQQCHGQGHNQLIRLNGAGQLGVGERCIEAYNSEIKLAFCRLGTVDGPWQYDEQSGTLLHRTHKKCMGYQPQTRQLALMPCDINNAYQSWKFKEIQPHCFFAENEEEEGLVIVRLLSLPYERFVRNIVKTEMDLFIAFGGLIGLFYGWSLLTTIDFLITVCHLVIRFISSIFN
uniref:Protein-UDP acetylgalactosaminyltransferase 7 n=1 Tax=Anopheles coluzzii TaxID=1518534 RepID=A0A8W7PQG1_ANOCL